MGILDWLRGSSEKKKVLPAPTPVATQPKSMPSDLPAVLPKKGIKPPAQRPLPPMPKAPVAPSKPAAPQASLPSPKPMPIFEHTKETEDMTWAHRHQPGVEPTESQVPATRIAPMATQTIAAPGSMVPRGEAPSHMFVSSDEYAQIIDKVNHVKSKLLSSQESIQDLEKIRNSESKQLEKWQEHLTKIEKKISYVEALIAKGGEI